LQRTIGELTGEINRFDREMTDLVERFEDAARKAEAFGISTAGLAEAQARATAELQRRQQAELDAMALSVIEPFRRLAQPLEALKTQREFSLLTPAEQAARAAADFRRLAAEAEAGSTVAIEQLVGASQLFIEQSGRFGASPAQVAAMQEVQNVLANVLTQIGQAQTEASEGIEDLLERIRRGTD